MSRCFPYTRPNYKREDVSVIGSIKSGAQKLQNQWGNSKQRKDVSREMKEKLNKKRSREEHDTLDCVELKIKKRKAEKTIKFNESSHCSRKEDSDHLERSDLSEELDPPAFVLSQSNFSEFTQNSSKKNGFQDADPNNKKPGLVFRVKLPLKKHKDPEPVSESTDPCCSSQVAKKSEVQAVLTESKSTPRFPSQVTKTSKVHAVLTESAPRRSSQITKSSKVRQVLTECAPRTPSQITKFSKVQTVLTESAPCCSSQVTKTSKVQAVLTESALRTEEALSAKPSSEEPCFSGRVADAPILQEGAVEASKSRHKRSRDGKSERQLFRDLIENWKPPSIQRNEADEGELDWLFASRRTSQVAKPSAQICEAGISDPSTCPSSASSLQPRAIYIPEFDMYQMPYVIPF